MGGENFSAWCSSERRSGSSPRGRGKLEPLVAERTPLGLIPAWAGKTHRMIALLPAFPAHPRVGGENAVLGMISMQLYGSSPRGRGKPDPRPRRHPSEWAHPRVGGENPATSSSQASQGGSSPRGRGKPVLHQARDAVPRLIPAWAGKTWDQMLPEARSAAHPRVGGENHARSSPTRTRAGSSPRGRGKLVSGGS